jgi:hypothetical protein
MMPGGAACGASVFSPIVSCSLTVAMNGLLM